MRRWLRAAGSPHYDVLVVGGGINGAGIARDLAGRGLSVLLCEKDDLASHTSSSSTKLIHGGLRYLEHYEFSLVRKALAEREVLLRSAPHIMWPLRFVMPHDPGMRPVWMMRAGLFLYDHLARREVLPGSTTVDLRRHVAGAPLKPRFQQGLRLFRRLGRRRAAGGAERDGRRRARRHGAHALRLRRCTARRDAMASCGCKVPVARSHEVTARALVNATGPWAAQFLDEHVHAPQRKALRLVKGSHVVVKKLFEHDHAYIFQNPDKRIIFAIPYERRFTLIGTTDVEHHGAIGAAHIDASEVDYLCEQASRYFERAVRPSRRGVELFGRAPAARRRVGRPVGRDARLCARARHRHERCPGGAVAVGVGRQDHHLSQARRRSGRPAVRASGWDTSTLRGAWTRGAFLPGGDLGGWIGKAQRPDTDFRALRAGAGAASPPLAGAAVPAPGARLRLARGHAAGARRARSPRWRPACSRPS